MLFLERAFKNLIQVVIANLVITTFVPYWSKITDACDNTAYEHGGLPKSETVAAGFSTLMFYVAAPLLLHLVINSVVYGFSRPKTKEEVDAAWAEKNAR